MLVDALVGSCRDRHERPRRVCSIDVLLFHGTEIDSAAALLQGHVLDAQIALSRHIDGKIGFYLATSKNDAEFFAVRRWEGTVIRFELSDAAVAELATAASVLAPVPGGNPPYFEGEELYVPPEAFGLFNKLRAGGEIVVRR
jgi:hypothetical protein